MRFYKKRLEKTLSFVFFKAKVVSNRAATISLIQSGNYQINKKKISKPNYLGGERDPISIVTKAGFRRIKR